MQRGAEGDHPPRLGRAVVPRAHSPAATPPAEYPTTSTEGAPPRARVDRGVEHPTCAAGRRSRRRPASAPSPAARWPRSARRAGASLCRSRRSRARAAPGRAGPGPAARPGSTAGAAVRSSRAPDDPRAGEHHEHQRGDEQSPARAQPPPPVSVPHSAAPHPAAPHPQSRLALGGGWRAGDCGRWGGGSLRRAGRTTRRRAAAAGVSTARAAPAPAGSSRASARRSVAADRPSSSSSGAAAPTPAQPQHHPLRGPLGLVSSSAPPPATPPPPAAPRSGPGA